MAEDIEPIVPEIDIQKELDIIHFDIDRLNTNIVQLGLDLLRAIKDIQELKSKKDKQELKITGLDNFIRLDKPGRIWN